MTLSAALLVTPPKEPEIVTDFVDVTTLVVMLKVALSAPAATVTVDGVVAADVSLLESETTAPPEGAAAVKVTVPVEELPPVTVAGLTETAESEGPEEAAGFIVSTALYEEDPMAARMFAAAMELTGPVVIVKLALTEPAGIVTLGGTETEGLPTAALAVIETTAPSAGAGAPSVTVPVDGLPPTTVLGFSCNDEITGPVGSGVTFSESSLKAPLNPARIEGQTDDVTRVVGIVNVTLVAPSGIVTNGGTLAGLGSYAAAAPSAISAPPAGAGAVRVTVPCALLPPTTVAGSTLKVAISGSVTGCGEGNTASQAAAVRLDMKSEVCKSRASCANCGDVTAFVVTLNVVLVAPGRRVTNAVGIASAA